MKYLTPELYAKINAANDDEVEGLYRQWTAAGANARRTCTSQAQTTAENAAVLRNALSPRCGCLGIEVSGGDNPARRRSPSSAFDRTIN